MAKNKSSYEGLQKNIRGLKMPRIEVFKNQYPDRDYHINIDYPEFTCICPKTNLPDFATLYIDYVPDKVCLELKSLKMYFIAYRQMGVFHEHVTNKIVDDIVAACKPRSCRIMARFNNRGGLQTTISAEYKKSTKADLSAEVLRRRT